MIKVIAIDHIVLRTDKLDKMIEFYQGVLGCKLERTLEQLGLYQLRAGSALIDIITTDGELGKQAGAPDQNHKNVDHLCLQISEVSVEELVNFLNENNVPIDDIANRYGATGFGDSIYIEDPQGNVIELKPIIEAQE